MIRPVPCTRLRSRRSSPDHPLLVVDLSKERGRQFRAVAVEISSLDNNLSIGNMGFAEFAELVDQTGVFRGIPGA